MFPAESDEENLFPLAESVAHRVVWYHGLVYIGLHHNKGKYTNIINMTMDEWLELRTHAPNIQASVLVTSMPASDTLQPSRPVKRVHKSGVKRR